MHRRHFLSAAAGTAACGLVAPAADSPKHGKLKITKVETFVLEYTLPKATGPSTAMYKTRDALIIKISTDAGLVGWAETANLPGTRPLIDSLAKSVLIGQDPRDHRRLWRGLWGPNFGNGIAVGGLDVALHDLWGKAVGLSVAELYGGRLRDAAVCYASAMNYIEDRDPETQYPEEAARLVKEKGFTALKMRIGGLPVKRDMAAAAAVRQAVGPDVKLMVDGNGAYTLGTAIKVGRELEKLEFYFYEEPLPQSHMDYPAYAELTSKLDIPIAAGECVDGRGKAKELITRGVCRIIQPDVCLCGGVREALFIAEMAKLWGMGFHPHCWGGALVIAATLQLLALVPDATWARTTEPPHGRTWRPNNSKGRGQFLARSCTDRPGSNSTRPADQNLDARCTFRRSSRIGGGPALYW